MRKHLTNIVIIAILIFESSKLFAQTTEAMQNRKYGIETSPIFPLVKIYAIQGTYSLWNKGDVIVGYAYQNQIIENEGQCHGHTLLLGYRQYVLKGLHVDIEFFPAVNNFYCYVDGKYYNGYEVVAEIRPGYRFDLKINNSFDVYILTQAAMLFGLYRDNPWPTMGNDPFFFPLVWIGISL